MQVSINLRRMRRVLVVAALALLVLPGMAWAQACSSGTFGPNTDARLQSFITNFYQTILGRSPSAPEVAFHVNYLKSNPNLQGFGAFTHAFFDGPENTAKSQTLATRATLLYQLVLNRTPAAAERDAWVTILSQRFVSALQFFVSSPEFQARLPLFQNRTSVEVEIVRFYETVLLRTPSQAEVNAWADFLLRNAGNLPLVTQDVIGAGQAFFGSVEYLSIARSLREHVRGFYRTLLNREPAEAEITGWTDFIVSQLAPIEDGFILSPEFFAKCQSIFQ
jgi:hypothetical protein